MSDEVTEKSDVPFERSPAPIQDVLEQIYTELGIAIDKRASKARYQSVSFGIIPLDYQHDIGYLAEALHNISSVNRW